MSYVIPNHENLTRAEEIYLCNRWQKQQCLASRARLVKHNMKFVAKEAFSLSGKYHTVSVDDLIGYGTEGLLKSLDTFDTTAGFKLITHSVWWIRQKITRGVQDNESAIRAPANIHEEIRKAIKETGELTDDQMHVLHNCTGGTKNDDVVGTDGTMTIADKYSGINHDPSTLTDSIIDMNSRDNVIHSMISELPQRERDVLVSIFGLGGGETKSFRETSEDIGMSHERVRQIRNNTLKKLKLKHSEKLIQYM